MKKPLKTLCLGLLLVLAAGLVVPERVKIPVAGASTTDWNARSFWFEPWGSSGVHKGIDIFGKAGTAVLSTTDGIVLFAGELAKGGKVVLVLGPRWRLHYFAHLDAIDTHALAPVASGGRIGTLGASGNAQGKPPHLHYSIVRLLPAPWKMDGATQGYKKAFFIDPNVYLRE
ncbi:MAG: M23 family metallopeptidase [Acidovorax sp.]|uniref:M23 family metallopeptidase n=1 Tax=Acidovorax sp. TaxID=1872122 RepID=UPI00391D0418